MDLRVDGRQRLGPNRLRDGGSRRWCEPVVVLEPQAFQPGASGRAPVLRRAQLADREDAEAHEGDDAEAVCELDGNTLRLLVGLQGALRPARAAGLGAVRGPPDMPFLAWSTRVLSMAWAFTRGQMGAVMRASFASM